MALLLDLPNELLFQITIYLTHHDIFHFLRANRRLARLLQTAQFDHLRRFRSVDHGRRALFHAAAREDTATVAELVRIGAHKFPGSRIHFLNSAIQNWCSAKTISIFLRCGIEADGTDTRGRTPLTIAARKGRADVVEVLLKVEGVRVNAQCHNGKTPFMLAALAGRTDVVRLLLEDERVDVGLRDTMPSANTVVHSTLLFRVVAAGPYDVTKLLLESPRIDHETELLGSNSCTVLWKAVEIGHRKVIKLLLDDGRSDPNFLSNGQTPLHCAIQRGHPEVVLLLLADPRIDVSKVSASGIAPIHLAAGQKNKTRVLEALLQDGRADVNARNLQGETPLFIAVTSNAQACVKLLLGVEGIDLSITNNNGLTLAAAAQSQYPPIWPVIFAMLRESTNKMNEEIKTEAQPREWQEDLERQRVGRLGLQARDLQAGAGSSESQVQVQEVGSKKKRKWISSFGLRSTWLTRLFVWRRKTNT